MEIEDDSRHEEIISSNNNDHIHQILRELKGKKISKFILLFLNIVLILIGGSGGPLILRFYFLHGGKRKWFNAFLQTAGFPFLLVPIFFSFFCRHSRTNRRRFLLTPTLLLHCTIIGLITGEACSINNAIPREGKHFGGHGEAEYYQVIFFAAVLAQFFLLGVVGTIKYSSALLGGIIVAVCVPVTEVFAVFFFHEKFDGEKGVALALSLWGTASYFYGEYKEYNNSKAAQLLPLSVISKSTEESVK
ncbi:purine permease 3-like [Phalaenopsis equestris]|uniref:purine permease 3-like n=1 Tax=Phalaenopsis equestris TaxID=78828 RepID=UPI0009E47555|nr:purine permease 3-like [Phalaenopsis equestris]